MMKRTYSVLTTIAILLSLLCSWSQAYDRNEVAIPDLPGYQTLKCDFHMHTVFSDGDVWPTVRVDEAWRVGLDVIAISDHIEVQRHKQDLSTDLNRTYEIAAQHAKELDILLIRAAEITRDTPPGHFNALFLSDAEALRTDDFVEAVKRANEQGAFVFWNHHAWKGEERGAWLDVHSTLYDNKWLHGMEVFNAVSYYPTAHQWCLEKGLTMLGNSDIHRPNMCQKSSHNRHAMTLVFVKERSLEAVKEALQQGRTAAWLKGRIVGREEFLRPLFHECVKVDAPHYRSKDSKFNIYAKIRNLCDMGILLKINEKRTGVRQAFWLPPKATELLEIATDTPDLPVDLKYTATNFLIAPDKSLEVTLHVPGKDESVKQ